MRYIDLGKLRSPDGWLAKATAAAAAVASGADPNDYSTIWRELKSAMTLLSHTKCWYCESPVDRDDNAVDHFRPKNNVLDAANPHQGYRWLAFDRGNFRLACTYCNSRRIDQIFGTAGGKADRFPLLDETKRVYSIGSVEAEEPELLDPCDIDDCEAIGCQQENGRPCPATDESPTKQRCLTSIEVYHLDRDATCKQRHSIAIRLISDLISAKRLFAAIPADQSKKREFLDVIKNVERCINKEAPYSGEMRYILRGQRSQQHPWIQKLLEV